MHEREVYFASPSTSVHRKKDSSPLIVSLEHIAKTRKQPWRGSPSWCSYPPCHPDTKSDNCLKSHTPLPGFVRKTTRNHVTPSSTVTRKRFVSSLYLGSIRMQTSPLLNRLRFLNRLTERKWLQHNSVLLGIILPGIPFVITNWLERTSIVTLAPPKPSLTWMCFSCWSVVKNHFSLRSFNGIYSSLNDFSYESFHNR